MSESWKLMCYVLQQGPVEQVVCRLLTLCDGCLDAAQDWLVQSIDRYALEGVSKETRGHHMLASLSGR
jgi:hypothetical protein